MIKIIFNNNNYSVDDSFLSTHSNDLKSHLSTVMNGTGAVINLGGTAYNVDSAKLATAKDAFVQHLGTIAGNGRKVKVGGVEYSIDNSKVAVAVGDIEAVLGGAISGGSGDEGDNVGVFHSGIIPEGGTYYVGVTATRIGDYTGATAIYNAGDSFPEIVNDGDVYVYGDYEYRYNRKHIYYWISNEGQNGWGVMVLDKNKSEYGIVLSGINNISITNMFYTFANCESLTTAPAIPAGVTDMSYTFSNCESLTGVIVINANPTKYDSCFRSVDFAAQNLALSGSSTLLDQIGATGTNYRAS